ncbi:hypothetical protein [Pseudomonas sp. SED1]|jgi:hypothetical protein|uniref:hypothetical protein n=1 Tax=Pseudomonas sp. SED1 TaxID=3056845 RepID=UPI00296E9303|nr:hypothetical protein [Pseudomonas sp. SED1]MDY0834830.1 hypothetical protein [Pseudomonas sp. SED1]
MSTHRSPLIDLTDFNDSTLNGWVADTIPGDPIEFRLRHTGDYYLYQEIRAPGVFLLQKHFPSLPPSEFSFRFDHNIQRNFEVTLRVFEEDKIVIAPVAGSAHWTTLTIPFIVNNVHDHGVNILFAIAFDKPFKPPAALSIDNLELLRVAGAAS